MIETKDRLPLGNGKNNIVKPAGIPSSITTVADLIAFLNAGFYADVKANNALTGNDVGVSEIGVPTNKALFDSIDEGSPMWPTGELDIQTGEKLLTAGWTYVAFPRLFMEVPKVTASVINTSLNSQTVEIKSIDTTGFYAAILLPASISDTTVVHTATACIIQYIAVVCDGLTNY